MANADCAAATLGSQTPPTQSAAAAERSDAEALTNKSNDNVLVKDDADLGDLTRRLLSFQTADYSLHPELTAQDCLTVCHLAINQLSDSTPTCVETGSPVNIVGDVRGQYHDLLRYFDVLGQPPQSKYLFLGNYVNYGKFSTEVVVLLLSLMVMYPDSVLLLRGNDDSASSCSYYGFKEELLSRFGSQTGAEVLVGFLRCFQWLPVAAVVGGKLFCCHAGISPSFLLEPFVPSDPAANIAQLNKIERPFELQQCGIACDLLWSHPMRSPARDNFEVSKPEEQRSKLNWVPGTRGYSYQFSDWALYSVLQLIFGNSILIRSHNLEDEGYSVSMGKRCITLFSAPGFLGANNNKGAILVIESSTVNVKQPGSFFVTCPNAERLSEENQKHLFWN